MPADFGEVVKHILPGCKGGGGGLLAIFDARGTAMARTCGAVLCRDGQSANPSLILSVTADCSHTMYNERCILTPLPPKPAPDGPAAASALTIAATNELRSWAERPADPRVLDRALRSLAKWRSVIVANTLIRRSGNKVLNGPFAGMDYSVPASEGAKAARLMGSYETTLVPVFEQVIAAGYTQIIDIGCAEGYYAVGLALRCVQARVMARDASPAAQALCRDHAARNGVSGRVEVGGEITGADFDCCIAQRTFVLCDIEGAEDILLDPVTAPGLAKADILVECHDVMIPGVTDRIAARFDRTHQITRIGRSLAPQTLPDWMEEFSDMDRLIALWEWRAGPTPWLWMQAR